MPLVYSNLISRYYVFIDTMHPFSFSIIFIFMHRSITSDACHPWFICMDQIKLQRTRRKRKLQNEIFLPTAGLEPTTLMIIRKQVLPTTSCGVQDKALASESEGHVKKYPCTSVDLLRTWHTFATDVIFIPRPSRPSGGI